ncbi:MAG: hypothetical protein JW715_05935 [Sedimentisphaerales bacterium]|nr:hypothetical protein [Sedimentisphaerales bacterium]
MSKKRRTKRRTKKPKSIHIKPQKRETWFIKLKTAIINGYRKKWLKRMITIISVIIALVGLGSAILSFLPKISLSPEVSLNSSNPFEIIFTLSNDGPFKIKNITYEINVLHLSSDGSPNIEMHGNRNVKFVHTEPEIPELKSGEKTSLRRALPIKGNNILINNCEIEIFVSFKPSGWPFKKNRRFRYLAVKDQNNQWHWTHRASSEKY